MNHQHRSSWRAGPLARLVSALAGSLFGSDQHDASIQGDWWPRYLSVAGLLAAVIFLRRPDAVSRPQFWAEDGLIYFGHVRPAE